MRAVTVAAVQVAPSHGPLSAESIAANCEHAARMVRDCVAATGAELVVLPESVTTGFTPGVDVATLWDLVSGDPGRYGSVRLRSAPNLILVVGSYERGLLIAARSTTPPR